MAAPREPTDDGRPSPPPPDEPPDDGGGPTPDNVVGLDEGRLPPFIGHQRWHDEDGATRTAAKVDGTQPELWVDGDRRRIWKASNGGPLSVAYGWCPTVVGHVHTPDGRKGQRRRLTLRVGAAETEASEADLEDGTAWERLGVPVTGSRNRDQLAQVVLVLADAHDRRHGRTTGYPHTGWHHHHEHGWLYLWPDGRTTPPGMPAVFTGGYHDQPDPLVTDAAPPDGHPAGLAVGQWAVETTAELLPGAAHGLTVLGLAARSLATSLHPMPCALAVEGEAGVGKTSLAGIGRALAVNRTAPTTPNVTFRARSAGATTNSIQPAVDREADLPVLADDVLAADEGRATAEQVRAGQTLLDQLAGAAETHGPIRTRLNRDSTAQTPYRARGGMTMTVQSLPPQLDRSVLRRLLLLTVPAAGELHERVKTDHRDRERGLRSVGERIIEQLAGQLADGGEPAAWLAAEHEHAAAALDHAWRREHGGEPLPYLLDLPAAIAAEAIVGLRMIENAAGLSGLADRLADRLPHVLAGQLHRMAGRDTEGRSPVDRLLTALGERLAAGDSGAAHRRPPRIERYGGDGCRPPELAWPDDSEPVPPAVVGWHADPRSTSADTEWCDAVTVGWADPTADRLYLPEEGKRELCALADELARHDPDMPTGSAVADALDRHGWLWDREPPHSGPKRQHRGQRARVWALRLSDALAAIGGGPEPDTPTDGPDTDGTPPDRGQLAALTRLARAHPAWAAWLADDGPPPDTDGGPAGPCITCGVAAVASLSPWCSTCEPYPDPPWYPRTVATAHHHDAWAAHVIGDRADPPDVWPDRCLTCDAPGRPDAHGWPWCDRHHPDDEPPPLPPPPTDGPPDDDAPPPGGPVTPTADHPHTDDGGPPTGAAGPVDGEHASAGGPMDGGQPSAGGPVEANSGATDGGEELRRQLAGRLDHATVHRIDGGKLDRLAEQAAADGHDLAELAAAATGSLDGARDPAAVVVGRLRDALDREQTPRLAALGPDGLTLADGSHHPVDPPQHAGELLDAARACGLATDGRGDTVYVHPSAYAAMGLPAELPLGADWQHPHSHPWVDRWCEADGDADPQPAGLAARLTVLRRGTYGRLTIVFTGYDTRQPAWTDAADGGELAIVAARFAAVLGVPYRPAPSTTGLRVLRQLGGELTAPGEPPPPATSDDGRARGLSLSWARPLADGERDARRPLIAADRNAAYLTAASGLDLPLGEHGWQHRAADDSGPVAFDKRQPGYWRCQLDPPTIGPDPFRGGGDGWWPTPTVALAVEWGQQPTVSEAWTAPRRRALDRWYQRMRDARAELIDGDHVDRLALAAVKQCYTAAIGSLAYAGRDPASDPVARPDWRDHVHANHVGRIARDTVRILAAGGPEPLAVTDTDTVWWIGEPDETPEGLAARIGLSLGQGLGEWKIKATTTVDRLLAHLDVVDTAPAGPADGVDGPGGLVVPDEPYELADAALATCGGGDPAVLAGKIGRRPATVRRWIDRTGEPDAESQRRLARALDPVASPVDPTADSSAAPTEPVEPAGPAGSHDPAGSDGRGDAVTLAAIRQLDREVRDG